jgi:ABC-type uncharacterized transport system auxiliary subunit
MKIVLSLITALLFTGCGILSTQPYIQTYYYDIGSPSEQIVQKDWNLEIISFNTSGPYQQRMVFRTGPNSIKFDEFNRWSMSPAKMFKRYLFMVYDCGDETRPEIVKKYSINGEIIQLEADLAHKMVNLAIRFSFSETISGKDQWTRTFKQQIPVDKVTGDSYAAAVKKATENMIKQLNTHLQSAK